MVRSDLHNFSDAYIVVKEIIAVTNPDDAERNKSVAFKNNAPFISCISKINDVQIDNPEDVEYNKNYKKTAGSLQNYYTDEPSDSLSSNYESCKYKTSVTGNTYNIGAGEAGYDSNKVGKNKTEIVLSLKHLNTLNTKLIVKQN